MSDADPQRWIYACLNLRLSIEALTYERVERYADDLSKRTMKSWHPAELLKALVRLDPQSESDMTLEIDLYEGRRPPLALEEKRLKTDWAVKAHGLLGERLHDRGASRLLKADKNELNATKTEIMGILEELETILDSTGIGLEIWQTFLIRCGCGAEFELRIRNGQLRKDQSCPQCLTQWVCTRVSPDEVNFHVESPRRLSHPGTPERSA